VNIDSTKTNNENEYNLTEREKEILKHLVDGLEYKEIADLTTTSPNTVRNHITNIYKKLHVTSKAQAIRVVINKKRFMLF
jgi:DNA-binding NarL/FixJ family response regulator